MTNSTLTKLRGYTSHRRNLMAALTIASMTISSAASAATGLGGSFPLSDFFCKVALALQSQWAPGIIIICIIVEGLIYLVAKKGVMQQLMTIVLAATIIFGAARLLGLIKPGAACVSTTIGSLYVEPPKVA